jgi:hypothetical protein
VQHQAVLEGISLLPRHNFTKSTAHEAPVSVLHEDRTSGSSLPLDVNADSIRRQQAWQPLQGVSGRRACSASSSCGTSCTCMHAYYNKLARCTPLGELRGCRSCCAQTTL